MRYRILLIFLFFVYLYDPLHLVFAEDTEQCFTLYREKKLCGIRSIFENKKERDYLYSSFYTLSVTIPLPPKIVVNVGRNTNTKIIIVWATDGDAFYGIGIDVDFEKAVDKLMHSIQNKIKHVPPIPPLEKRECADEMHVCL